MNIRYSIVHQLIKEMGKTGSSIDLSVATLENDKKSSSLISELHEKYKSLTNIHAVFEDDEKNPQSFSKLTSKYLTNENEKEFIEFSHNTLIELNKLVGSIQSAKGGFLLFADYEYYGRFIGVYFIRNKHGSSFYKDPGKKSFAIDTPEHVDIDKMAMACRINIGSLQNKDGRYLSFIKKSNEAMSDYFIRWISAEDKEDNRQDTSHLLDILSNLELPQKVADKEYNNLPEFLQFVNSHIKTLPGLVVDVKVLSQTLYGDANKITNYAEETGKKINGVFRADRTILKKFIFVKAKADSIGLEFPPKLFNNKVKINKEKNTVTIYSSNLVQKILNELNTNEE